MSFGFKPDSRQSQSRENCSARMVAKSVPAIVQGLFRSGSRRGEAFVAGLAAAAIFIGLTGMRLTAQGLYYDELHQATASFAYCGKAPELFCNLQIGGVPLLNMKYSGALKTAVYGLYLRWTGSKFSVASWRSLGIVFVCAGITLFCVLVRPRMFRAGMLLFLLLLLTDSTVILASRHDWGPVALALFLRLLLIAAWMRHDTTKSPRAAFGVGALASLAVFEKLSSVVLFAPLLLVLAQMGLGKSFRNCGACIAGAAVGGLPLLFVNVHSYYESGLFISLAEPAVPHRVSFSGFWPYFAEFLSLGDGAGARRFILGTAPATGALESYVVGLAGLLVVGLAVRSWRCEKRLPLSGWMVLSYVAVSIGLYLLPRPTSVHHWILGTPFQYGAFALALGEMFAVKPADKRFGLAFPAAFVCLLAVLLASRGVNLISLEKSMLRGDATTRWDASLTQLGQAAAKRAGEAIFICADWGVATQIYCYSGGESGLVYEPFFDDQGMDQVKKALENSRKNVFYLVQMIPATSIRVENTQRVLKDVEALSSWQEVTVEKDLGELHAVSVRKFRRGGS